MQTRGCVFAAVLLLASLRLVAQGAGPTIPDGDLQAEFTKAVNAFMEEYRAADASAREKLLVDPAREPRHRFTPLFLAAAERHQKSPEAISYWAWLVENATIVDPQLGERAVTRLLQDHLADPLLAPGAKAVGRAVGVRGRERTVADLTRIIEGSPHAEVRAEALLQRGIVKRDDQPTEGLKDFERAVREAPASASGKRAADLLAAARPLAVGDRVPDFEARTLSGSSIKLSALRGRVVLIDFWGMWCGPCVAQLPRLRTLFDRYHGSDFEIVGINSDSDMDALRRFVVANRVDWTTVLDGTQTGPIAKAWRVEAWPTVVLLDQSGVVRAKDIAIEALDAAISETLKRK